MYSTIKLRTRDFYEVIVDEGKVRFNHPLTEIEREYNLIVLVNSEIDKWDRSKNQR